MNKEEVKDVDFYSESKLKRLKSDSYEYLDKVSDIYTKACYIESYFVPWITKVSVELEKQEEKEIELNNKERRLEEKEQELEAQKDKLFLKEKNIRTADAATCANINKFINKTEDILSELKDKKEKMKLFEVDMYIVDNKVEVGEVSRKQKVLTIVVMVVFLGLLGFVLCVK